MSAISSASRAPRAVTADDVGGEEESGGPLTDPGVAEEGVPGFRLDGYGWHQPRRLNGWRGSGMGRCGPTCAFFPPPHNHLGPGRSHAIVSMRIVP